MKVIKRAIWIIIAIYMMILILGYVSTQQDSPEIILTRASIPGSPLFLNASASACMLIVLVANCITNYFPFRATVLSCLGVEYSEGVSLSIAFGFWISVTIISLVFPNVTGVLGLFGGLASVNICYLIPLYSYLTLSQDPITSLKNISAMIYFSLLIVAGWSSSIYALTELINY